MNGFQDRLQEFLSLNNISRLALSKTLGVSSTTINDYFNKHYYPNIKIAIKMAQTFNCSLDYLFGLSDEAKCINKNDKSFIETFDSLLKENKISIAKALRDLKMSEYNYYRWKCGMFPRTINLLEIVKYFDVSLDYLVGYTI